MYDTVCGRPVPGKYRANINDSCDAFIPSLVMVVTLSSAPSASNTITSSQWPVSPKAAGLFCGDEKHRVPAPDKETI